MKNEVEKCEEKVTFNRGATTNEIYACAETLLDIQIWTGKL